MLPAQILGMSYPMPGSAQKPMQSNQRNMIYQLQPQVNQQHQYIPSHQHNSRLITPRPLYGHVRNDQVYGQNERSELLQGMPMGVIPGQSGVQMHKRMNSISFATGAQANGLAMHDRLKERAHQRGRSAQLTNWRMDRSLTDILDDQSENKP